MLSVQNTLGCQAPLYFSPFRTLSRTNGCGASSGFYIRKWNVIDRETRQIFSPIFCSATGDGETSDASVVRDSPATHGGSMKNNGSHPAKEFASNEVLEKLKRYGISGVLSYGLLNTAYYLSTFILVWFYIAPVPGRMGYGAAAKRFLKIAAMVWAGSQVTKIPRAGGALALAPLVDSGLSWFTEKFKFESRRKAFLYIVGSCLGLAFLLFLLITLLWA
ncbi:hypothetical protein H6P81_002600 [Aristolochia fimbriata]|uniref:Uncharacterized protein n=1 Tax=Aristolochia fimbriata TaxID=158543 RepID=A0AAV7FA76_ARIFI|nr:hypothetical protein H6P81_002600 [Aristolochia fimbriata]